MQDTGPPRRSRRLLAAFLIAAAGLGGGALADRALIHLAGQPGPAPDASVIVITPGASLAEAARLLDRAGLIENLLLFRYAAWRGAQEGIIKTGEYEIPARASAAHILAILRSGRSVLHRLTIPEGWTVHQVAEILRANTLLTGETGPPPPEGSLLPETYYFIRGDSRRKLLTRMRQARRKLLADLWAARAPDLPYANPGEAVILASLIEKETGKAEERRTVAAVFLNRLQRGMRLQSDPTVIYGLTEGRALLRRPLSRRDLARRTPYNTYLIKGLPPGPIANPGRAALEAALSPPVSDHLYFVADGKGGHLFARTLEDHERNVARWRKIESRRARKP